MIPATQALDEEARIAALKRLITSLRRESLETLEDSVDAFLWGRDETSDLRCEEPGSRLGMRIE